MIDEFSTNYNQNKRCLENIRSKSRFLFHIFFVKIVFQMQSQKTVFVLLTNWQTNVKIPQKWLGKKLENFNYHEKTFKILIQEK